MSKRKDRSIKVLNASGTETFTSRKRAVELLAGQRFEYVDERTIAEVKPKEAPAVIELPGPYCGTLAHSPDLKVVAWSGVDHASAPDYAIEHVGQTFLHYPHRSQAYKSRLVKRAA